MTAESGWVDRGALGEGDLWAAIRMKKEPAPRERGEGAVQALGWEGAGRAELRWRVGGQGGKQKARGVVVQDLCRSHVPHGFAAREKESGVSACEMRDARCEP